MTPQVRRGLTRDLDQLADPYRALMAGMVRQAIEDLADKQAPPMRRLEAMCWLATDEAKAFIDVLELPHPFTHFRRVTKIRRPHARRRELRQ